MRVLVLVAGCVLLSRRAEPQGGAAPLPPRADLCLPGDPLGGEIVSPYGLDVPRECAEFIARTGADWFIVWDRALAAPRLVFPTAPFRLLPEGAVQATEAVADLVLAFVEEHQGLFAVPPAGLSPPAVFRLDDGYLLSAHQLHEGLPVRGSSLRVRLNHDLTLRSIQCRLARWLPALSAPTLTEAAAAERARADGLGLQAWAALQVAFPAGLESAVAAWAVAGASGVELGQVPDELELLYSASSGARLLRRSTALHFDCQGPLRVEGSLAGYSPPPDDIYSLPAEINRDQPYPLAGVPVFVSSDDRTCPAWDAARTREDGAFTADLERFAPEVGLTLSFTVGYASANGFLRFGFSRAREDYRAFARRFLAGDDLHLELNRARAEFDSLHLMTFHHLRRAEREVEALVARHGLDYDAGPLGFPVAVQMRKDLYEHRYFPSVKWLFLGSDEVTEMDGAGRWRKLVPTVIYHEWGHEVFRALVNAYGELEVHEGIADAFAGYVARASTLGFVDPATPSADGAARDLRFDTMAFPDEPRRSVAGALWELWEGTLDAPAQGDPPTAGPPRSPSGSSPAGWPRSGCPTGASEAWRSSSARPWEWNSSSRRTTRPLKATATSAMG